MNGKFEEKLAQLAFGDLSPEEAARIEAQVRKDPMAARALEEYRAMRGGLQSMAVVPEHQLSNERLRDAILAQGLRPQPVETPAKKAGWNWAWMPVAACALGFVMMTARNQPAHTPQVVMNMPLASSEISFSPKIDGMVASLETQKPAAKSADVKKSMQATLVSRNETKSNGFTLPPKEHRRDRFTKDAAEIHPQWGPIETGGGDEGTRLALNGSKEANPTADPIAVPIVLIDGTSDAETGAPTATEIGTASNVLVGG